MFRLSSRLRPEGARIPLPASVLHNPATWGAALLLRNAAPRTAIDVSISGPAPATAPPDGGAKQQGNAAVLPILRGWPGDVLPALADAMECGEPGEPRGLMSCLAGYLDGDVEADITDRAIWADTIAFVQECCARSTGAMDSGALPTWYHDAARVWRQSVRWAGPASLDDAATASLERLTDAMADLSDLSAGRSFGKGAHASLIFPITWADAVRSGRVPALAQPRRRRWLIKALHDVIVRGFNSTMEQEAFLQRCSPTELLCMLHGVTSAASNIPAFNDASPTPKHEPLASGLLTKLRDGLRSRLFGGRLPKQPMISIERQTATDEECLSMAVEVCQAIALALTQQLQAHGHTTLTLSAVDQFDSLLQTVRLAQQLPGSGRSIASMLTEQCVRPIMRTWKRQYRANVSNEAGIERSLIDARLYSMTEWLRLAASIPTVLSTETDAAIHASVLQAVDHLLSDGRPFHAADAREWGMLLMVAVSLAPAPALYGAPGPSWKTGFASRFLHAAVQQLTRDELLVSTVLCEGSDFCRDVAFALGTNEARLDRRDARAPIHPARLLDALYRRQSVHWAPEERGAGLIALAAASHRGLISSPSLETASIFVEFGIAAALLALAMGGMRDVSTILDLLGGLPKQALEDPLIAAKAFAVAAALERSRSDSLLKISPALRAAAVLASRADRGQRTDRKLIAQWIRCGDELR